MADTIIGNDGAVYTKMESDEPQGVVDDVVKGCFGALLLFGSISTGMIVLIVFAVKIF